MSYNYVVTDGAFWIDASIDGIGSVELKTLDTFSSNKRVIFIFRKEFQL